MCFHSKQSKKAQEIENRFNAKFENIDDFVPTQHYNGFNFPMTPVITNEKTGRIEMYSWGLVPHWAKQNWNRTYTLNARIETIKEKPAFKSYVDNRCIILVNGFYEWQHIGKRKVKHEIGFNGELFAFAGLYSPYNSNGTYSIITTEAQGIMREIAHNKRRMPVAVKDEDEISNWLFKSELQPRSDFSAIPLV